MAEAKHFLVRTKDKNTKHSDHHDMKQAEHACAAANEKAEKLGIKVRYVASDETPK